MQYYVNLPHDTAGYTRLIFGKGVYLACRKSRPNVSTT